MPARRKAILKESSAIQLGILILLALYLAYILFPVLLKVFEFLFHVSIPFIMAIILYYLLRPLVRRLSKRVPLNAAILISYLVLFSFIAFLILFIFPRVQEQISLIQQLSKDNKLKELSLKFRVYFPQEIRDVFYNFFSSSNQYILSSVVYLFSTLAEFLFNFVVALLLLYYFFKDDKKFYSRFIQLVPAKYQEYTKNLLDSIDDALEQFLTGRIVIAAFSSLLLLITYLAIGLDFAFLLSVFALIFYIIPTIGSFLVLVLPLLVGFNTSLTMGFEVLVLTCVVNWVEGFVITPWVMGREMFIHPATLILLLLVAGPLFGIFGLLLSVPLYIILKIFIQQTYDFLKYKKKEPLLPVTIKIE